MKHKYIQLWLANFISLLFTHAAIDPLKEGNYSCPAKCGHNPSDWTSFVGLQDILDNCQEPILFDFNVRNSADNPELQLTTRSCSLSGDENVAFGSLIQQPHDSSAAATENRRPINYDCGGGLDQTQTIAYVDSNFGDNVNKSRDVSEAAGHLISYLRSQPSCDTTILFVKVGDSILGLYSGSQVSHIRAVAMIQGFKDYAINGSRILQVCDEVIGTAQTFGVYAGEVDDMENVHDVVVSWTKGCLDTKPLGSMLDFSLSALDSSIEPDDTLGTTTKGDREARFSKRAEYDTSTICDPDDGTYSSEPMPPGNYTDWGLLGLDNLTTGRQYVTIVNLTPHRFKLDSTHSYQMDIFDWGDIPPGRARQNLAHYTEAAGKNAVDDNGEAYYSIEGTDKKFAIRATTHIPDRYWRRTVIDLSGMGLGQREYSDPRPEVPVTLVITGSESYGFITSLSYGPGNWMKRIYDVISTRPIQHIIIPGTHDSGMSTISNKIVSLGSPANTQTQALSIYNQLRVGARWFDLRIMSVHQSDLDDYGFWIAHVNSETAEVPVGNTGESLVNVIAEINQFTSENPGEVIFFHVRYLVGIRRVPSGGPIYWGNDTLNRFFGELKKTNNRCGNLNTSIQFQHQKASYFMDKNNGTGCVIFLLDGSNLKEGVPHTSVVDGLYGTEQMAIDDHWSNLANTQAMAENQISVWAGIERAQPFAKDEFLISQWLVSADAVTTTVLTIQGIAILPTNPTLYWAGVNAMSPKKWPNVMLIDYIGVVVTDQFAWDQLSAELYTLAIGLNLYMISENCDVSHQRSPLLPPLLSSASKTIKRDHRLRKGIIFANGTVIDHAPPNLHPGRVEVLKSGTVFGNGTVLKQDIRNPNFNSTLF